MVGGEVSAVEDEDGDVFGESVEGAEGVLVELEGVGGLEDEGCVDGFQVAVHEVAVGGAAGASQRVAEGVAEEVVLGESLDAGAGGVEARFEAVEEFAQFGR